VSGSGRHAPWPGWRSPRNWPCPCSWRCRHRRGGAFSGNGALTLLAAGGWLAAPLGGGDQPAALLAVAGAVGLVAAILVVTLDEVLALFTDPARPAAP
jgi:hypothetical protein